MHVQKLESDLGVKLLERGKKLQLTKAGRLFNQNADVLLKNYDFLSLTMSELIQGEAGLIRIGAMEPTASYRLPQIIGPFLKQYPKIQISIQINNTNTLSQMLDEGSIDLAICSTPDSGIDHIFEPLFHEELGLLLPKTHELSRKSQIYLKDLQHKTLLLTTSECPYRRKLETALLEKGASPYTGMEIGSMAALKFYVQEKFGIAVLPIITASPPPEGTVLKLIEDLDSGLVTGMLYKKGLRTPGSAAEKLINTLKQGLGSRSLQPV